MDVRLYSCSVLALFHFSIASFADIAQVRCDKHLVDDSSQIDVRSLYDSTCMGPLLGIIETNLYNFTYESWIRKGVRANQFAIGQCFQNRKDDYVWLSFPKWEGHISPEDNAGMYEFNYNNNCRLYSSEILFGARPDRHPFTFASGSSDAVAVVEDGKEEESRRTETIVKAAVPVSDDIFVDTYYHFVSEYLQIGSRGLFSYSISMYAETVQESRAATSAGIILNVDNAFILSTLGKQNTELQGEMLASLNGGVLASGESAVAKGASFSGEASKRDVEFTLTSRNGDTVGRFSVSAFVP